MNIEKVKEALAACAGIENIVKQIEQYEEYTEGSPMLGTCRGLYEIKKAAKLALSALAELEKPGEDAREVARIVHEECFVDISQTTSTPSRSLIWDIDTAAHFVKSFAASYHAEQCAKCKALPEPPRV